MDKNNNLKQDVIEIDLRDLFREIISNLWAIILVGIVACAAAVVFTMAFIAPQYQSTTSMYVLSKQENSVVSSADLQTSALLAQDYSFVIQSRTVLEAVIKDLDLDIDYDKLKNKMDVEVDTESRVISINAYDTDPVQASKIADKIQEEASERILNVMNVDAINVIDKANVPTDKYSPSKTKNGLLAGFIGCFLAGLVVIIRYILNDSIKSEEDVERFLNGSTLAVIPLEGEENKSKKKFKIRK